MLDIINFVNQNQEAVATSVVVILSVLFVWNIYLQYSLLKIKKRTRSFFANSEAKDLEEIIYKQIRKTNEIDCKVEKLISNNEKIKENLSKCIQKIGVVRFNPFNDTGGNQSFAAAFLDNYLNGIIILGLYSRDGVRVYSKQVRKGKSEYILSKEEEEAIKVASEES
jgi:hypothetical protein